MGLRDFEEQVGESRAEIREQETGVHRLTLRDPVAGMISSNIAPDTVLALFRALQKFCAPQVVRFDESVGAADTFEMRRDPSTAQ